MNDNASEYNYFSSYATSQQQLKNSIQGVELQVT